MTKYLNKTKIEWCDYTHNPAYGCNHKCVYCYARKMSHRFGRSFEPHFYPERVDAPLKHKTPSRIFEGSMTDMFGEWVPGDWLVPVFEMMSAADWHQFFVLTKNPRGIRKLYDETTNWYFGGGDFLSNVFLGVSVTYQDDDWRIDELRKQWVGPKFISFEPLYDKIECDLNGIDWIIIGAQTNPTVLPTLATIESVLYRAQDTPVFFKNNIRGVFGLSDRMFRQDFPVIK
ncbi:MAG: Phage protein Gp37/Gp68 [Bacteroidetes bacterium ADurb.BinA104]|nr:MAG: Phage protein Gp37/Gp68 [Bacteroidetes bacterium ADurb.BinA104]